MSDLTSVPIGSPEWRGIVRAQGGFVNETDEPVDPTLACLYWVHRLTHKQGQVLKLIEAIQDIDAHARPLATDEDGFVAGGYLISIGSLHRALALTGTAPPCRECPHDAAHFTTATKWNESSP